MTTCSCDLYSWDGGPTPAKCFQYGCDPASGIVFSAAKSFGTKTIPDYTSYLGRKFLRENLNAGNTNLPWGMIVKALLDSIDLEWAKSKGMVGEELESWKRERGIYDYLDDKPK